MPMLMGFIASYLLITILIGWWAARRVKNTRDFVMAGRHLPLFMAASALFATWFGSETVMGASAEFMEHGLMGVVEDPFGASLCLFIVGFFYARPLYRLNVLTFNDFYRLRYSRLTEFISAFLMVPSYFSWVAAQLVALAIILKVVAGIPMLWGIFICTLVVVVYTYVGGMWAVSVTDSVQTIIIIGGMLYLSLVLVGQVGGLEKVVAATPSGFFRFYPRFDLLEITHYIAALMTLGLGSIPAQDIFQRVMSARNAQTAVRASWLSGFMYLTVGMLPLLIGLCSKILYPELMQGDTQLTIPQVVLRHGTMLMQILFFGALLSAILSTTSGAILAPATVIGENLVRPYMPNLTDARLLQIMRLGVVGVAICSAAIAALEGSIYELVSLSSAFTLVSLFVPLTAGLYWSRASTAGALLAIGSGMTVWVLCLLLSTEVPAELYGFSASLLAMIGGSLFFPDQSYQQFCEATKPAGTS